MYQNLETSSIAEGTAWEQRFCPTAWCSIETVYVLRYEHEHELWRVSLNLDESGWLAAANGPVCPICGGDLLTAANVADGVANLA